MQSDEMVNKDSLADSLNRLTLNESGAVEKDFTKAEAAVESAAVPLPDHGPRKPEVLTSKPDAPLTPILPGMIEPQTPDEKAERQYHLKYMDKALEMVDQHFCP